MVFEKSADLLRSFLGLEGGPRPHQHHPRHFGMHGHHRHHFTHHAEHLRNHYERHQAHMHGGRRRGRHCQRDRSAASDNESVIPPAAEEMQQHRATPDLSRYFASDALSVPSQEDLAMTAVSDDSPGASTARGEHAKSEAASEDVAIPSASSTSMMRTWLSSTGRHSIRATYVPSSSAAARGAVRLRREAPLDKGKGKAIDGDADGADESSAPKTKLIEVKLASLCLEDQLWVRRERGEAPPRSEDHED